MQIPEKVKLEVFNWAKEKATPFNVNDEYEGIISFLEEIWDLRFLPSRDARFNNALDDSFQHLVNNDDWSYEYTFLERFELLDDDPAFIRFLEALVSPKHRKDQDQIDEYKEKINSFIEPYDLTLAIVNRDPKTDYTINKVIPKSQADNWPDGLEVNDIRVFTYYEPINVSKLDFESVETLVLIFKRGWNDYSYQSSFNLFYYGTDNDYEQIGELKIITSSEDKIIPSNVDEDYRMTSIPEEFYVLSKDYCSLGQSEKFYRNMHRLLGPKMESVLFALRDVAFDTDIQDEFENKRYFRSSLVRYESIRTLMYTIKDSIEGRNQSVNREFTYSFIPQYAENPTDISFNFNTDLDIPNRIIAFIGKNGVGKTQLLSKLPSDIYESKKDRFKPAVPRFSKYLIVSYSAFDSFNPLKKTREFNYTFCSIRDDKGKIRNERSLSQKFRYLRERIEKFGRIEDWLKILLRFMSEDEISRFIVETEEPNQYGEFFKIDLEEYNTLRRESSSGQEIVFQTITDIIANIRYNSIILYDEPETHLHPNAISSLMNTLYELVSRFDSVCIIFTHSPLVIRELLSRNVYVMERENKYLSVQKLGQECFGENLTTLTEVIFGNRDVPKQYKRIIQRLVKEGKDVEQIIESINSNEVPVSLNTRIFIESLLRNNHD